jgi:hypothetical protein
VIVLDEQLDDERIIRGVERVYQGAVRVITDLAPAHTLVKDELIPRLLRQHRGATFVTINWTDFWRVVETDPRCSYLCLTLSSSRVLEVPAVLNRTIKSPGFRQKRQRCGKVILVRASDILWYDRLSDPVHSQPIDSA